MDSGVRDFVYNRNNYDLYPSACLWLRQMGLKETRWFLDTEWLLSSYNSMSYKEWIDE